MAPTVNAKYKAKALGKNKAKVKESRDRTNEHKQRWMEIKLQNEDENGLAKKSWDMLKKAGKTMAAERADFMEKYQSTGDFSFVTGLKWNVNLDSEATVREDGWLTESMIFQKECQDQQATKAIIDAAKRAGQYFFDEYRNTHRYFYQGIDNKRTKSVREKGIRSEASTDKHDFHGIPTASHSSAPPMSPVDESAMHEKTSEIMHDNHAESVADEIMQEPAKDDQRSGEAHIDETAHDLPDSTQNTQLDPDNKNDAHQVEEILRCVANFTSTLEQVPFAEYMEPFRRILSFSRNAS